MNKIPIAAFAISLLFLSTSPGQTDKPPTHQVDFPSGDYEWSVTFQEQKLPEDLQRRFPEQNAAEKEKKFDTVKRITITREGKLRRDTMFWESGGKAELWWPLNARAVFYEPGPNKAVRMKKSNRITSGRYDESNFNWISSKTFKGEAKLADKDCFYYESQSKPKFASTAQEANDLKTIHQAWIDQETGMPVGYAENGGRVAVFNFAGPYAGPPLTMPEKVREQIRIYNAYRQPLTWGPADGGKQ